MLISCSLGRGPDRGHRQFAALAWALLGRKTPISCKQQGSGPSNLSQGRSILLRMNELLIFDGDDTLWMIEPLYDNARLRASSIVGGLGINPDLWQEQQRKIDVANVGRMGLTSARFPTSCVEALDKLARKHGIEVSDESRRQVYQAAATVFTEMAPLAPGARETLEQLSHQNHLALLTKGDLRVQERRIAQSGLADFFDSIDVVPEKTSTHFLSLARKLHHKPSTSWSIGNSLGSDIIPAHQVGMRAIWIDAYVWEYERDLARHVPDGVMVSHSLEEVPILLRELQQEAL